jgi:hypothetical protein
MAGFNNTYHNNGYHPGYSQSNGERRVLPGIREVRHATLPLSHPSALGVN